MLKLLSVVPVLAVALSACDSADTMTSPDLAMQSQVSDLRAAPQPEAPKFGMMNPVLAGGSTSSAVGVNYIGAEGGVVKVWGAGQLVAQLSVPAGAVDVGALFEVTIAPNGQVLLTASRFQKNDVGTQGFHKKVILYYNRNRVTSTFTAAGLRAGTSETTAVSAPMAGTTADAEGGCSLTDPSCPPEGEGWVWMELEGFLGSWVYIG
jgi:hypothetical protein